MRMITACVLVLPLLLLIWAPSGVTAQDGWKEPDSCFDTGVEVCPKDGAFMHYSSHIKCLLRNPGRIAAIQPHCLEYVEMHRPCAHEVHHYCPDMSYDETMHCLNDHHTQLTEGCTSSLFMRGVHEDIGKREVTALYGRKYHAETDRLQAMLKMPSPPVEEL